MDKVLIGTNLVLTAGIAVCYFVLLKRPTDVKLIRANMAIYIALLVALLLQSLLASTFTQGSPLLYGVLYVLILIPLCVLLYILYAKGHDALKMKLLKSLKALQVIAMLSAVLLTFYNQNIGYNKTKQNS